MCGICVDIMTVPVALECGHTFCYPCIGKWLAQKYSCPTCRLQLFDPPHLSFALKDCISALLEDMPDTPDKTLWLKRKAEDEHTFANRKTTCRCKHHDENDEEGGYFESDADLQPLHLNGSFFSHINVHVVSSDSDYDFSYDSAMDDSEMDESIEEELSDSDVEIPDESIPTIEP